MDMLHLNWILFTSAKSVIFNQRITTDVNIFTAIVNDRFKEERQRVSVPISEKPHKTT